ncbi:hypothetical protein B7P43_G18316 [Cryptotermes secundus]|uniref:Uncharacterized protein n=1 Tax=Cryptotermes secundus TaxID=105785 RepID=A0A2J7QNL5_9NEOP|nr:hypothetical protein B7P43_G18316 [Cryptotermes secundus]
MYIRYWWESQMEGNHWEDQGIFEWAILKWILREIGWDGMVWIDLAQDNDPWGALLITAMNLQVPQNAGKFLSSCTIGGFSRQCQLHE